MQFSRIDDNSIRCTISHEEMDEHGIGVDDLMGDRDKAETFLRYVLQEAHDKADFEMTGGQLNVQLTVLPEGDVSLMISDNQGAALKNMIDQFRESLRLIREALASKQDPAKNAENFLAKLKGEGADEEHFEVVVWAEFTSLEDAIKCAHALPELKNVPATLYKYHDMYYLKFFIDSTRGEVATMSFIAAEYARTLYAESAMSLDVVEHGTVIIGKKAFKHLLKL